MYYTDRWSAWFIASCSIMQIALGAAIFTLNVSSLTGTRLWWYAILALSCVSVCKGTVAILAERHPVSLMLSVVAFVLGTLYFGISMSYLFPAAC